MYESLEEAQNQVKGVSGSEWKKFKNLEDANKYIEEGKFYKGKCYVVAKMCIRDSTCNHPPCI